MDASIPVWIAATIGAALMAAVGSLTGALTVVYRAKERLHAERYSTDQRHLADVGAMRLSLEQSTAATTRLAEALERHSEIEDARLNGMERTLDLIARGRGGR